MPPQDDQSIQQSPEVESHAAATLFGLVEKLAATWGRETEWQMLKQLQAGFQDCALNMDPKFSQSLNPEFWQTLGPEFSRSLLQRETSVERTGSCCQCVRLCTMTRKSKMSEVTVADFWRVSNHNFRFAGT